MKKKHLLFSIVTVALILVVLFMSMELSPFQRARKTYTVAVIVSDSNNDRWISMREGLEQAAKDEQMQLNYVSTDVLDDEQEAKLLERELQAGADALVLQAVGGSRVEAVLKKNAEETALMLLESDVEPQGTYPLTAPDAKNIGLLLADAVRTDVRTDEALARKKIGIICADQKQICMRERLAALTESLEAAGAKPAWVLEADGAELAEQLKKRQKAVRADIFIALGNTQTEAAIDYLQAQENGSGEILLYGTGCSEKTVYYLDKGIVSGLIVPNEFYMGYQSIHEVARQLKEHRYRAVSTTVECYSINRENIYQEENQKILFPIVQ